MHRIRRTAIWVALLAGLTVLSHAQVPGHSGHDGTGILIMAHGGDDAWDAAVEQAVAPIRREYPVAIAFGMADPVSLQQAVDQLEGRGVEKILVVRLFISGQSFLAATEYLFGKRTDAPRMNMHTAHGGNDSTKVVPLRMHAQLTISANGLLDSDLMGDLVLKRIRALSKDPKHESILILAHGPGDDTENEFWLGRIEEFADLSRPHGFNRVMVETLREDWPAKRAIVEQRIRAFVQEESSEGRTVLVIPFRLFGFGPYANVLDGLTYEADGMGLLPDETITEWIRAEIHLMERTDPGATRTPR